MTDDFERLDEAFAYLRENLIAYTDIAGEQADAALGVRMRIAAVAIETPIEVDLRVGDDGRVSIGCVPPLYRVETTVMPVFHRLRITAVPNGEVWGG